MERAGKRVGWLILLLISTVVLAIAANQIRFFQLFQPLQNWIFAVEDSYQSQFNLEDAQHPLILLPLAFGGGLIASVSPCILSLLPVNLSYIGTREITSRRDALFKASLFVLGVVTVLSLIGLFSSFAGAVLLRYRGYINIAVGGLMLLMGFSLLQLIRLSLPQVELKLPFAKNPLTNPYLFGLTFALVVSPCASPILFSVLAAATATGSQIQSVLTMVSYALGYTLILFLASVLTGLAKQTHLLLKRSDMMLRVGGVVLVFLGMYYLINGGQWIAAMLHYESF